MSLIGIWDEVFCWVFETIEWRHILILHFSFERCSLDEFISFEERFSNWFKCQFLFVFLDRHGREPENFGSRRRFFSTPLFPVDLVSSTLLHHFLTWMFWLIQIDFMIKAQTNPHFAIGKFERKVDKINQRQTVMSADTWLPVNSLCMECDWMRATKLRSLSNISIITKCSHFYGCLHQIDLSLLPIFPIAWKTKLSHWMRGNSIFVNGLWKILFDTKFKLLMFFSSSCVTWGMLFTCLASSWRCKQNCFNRWWKKWHKWSWRMNLIIQTNQSNHNHKMFHETIFRRPEPQSNNISKIFFPNRNTGIINICQ